jgi:uncharacterized protein YwgA
MNDGPLFSQQAKEQGLIDEILYHDEMLEATKNTIEASLLSSSHNSSAVSTDSLQTTETLRDSEKPIFQFLSLTKYHYVKSLRLQPSYFIKKAKVALIYCKGAIE